MRRLAAIVVLAASAAVLAPGERAFAADPAPVVEEIGDVQIVSPGEAVGKPSGPADLIGRLHPALVHFPIAWLLGLTIVDCIGIIFKREAWRRAGIFVLVATALSLLPAAATGFLRAGHIAQDPPMHALLVTHRALNIAVVALVLAALSIRAIRRNNMQRWWRFAYLALIFSAAGSVLLAADFGGRMVYGPNYLPW